MLTRNTLRKGPHNSLWYRGHYINNAALLVAGVCFRCCSYHQGWQDGTERSELAYYVPRTLNRTVPAYRTSVHFLKRTVPTYRSRTISKKAYPTSVPYFLAKIEAYRTVLPSLLLTTRNFN